MAKGVFSTHIGPPWMDGVMNVGAEMRHNKQSELLVLELGERATQYVVVEQFLSEIYHALYGSQE